MCDKDVLIPTKYNIYLQDLKSDYLEIELLGTVNSIDEARTMVKAFKESLKKDNLIYSTVFFKHIDV